MSFLKKEIDVSNYGCIYTCVYSLHSNPIGPNSTSLNSVQSISARGMKLRKHRVALGWVASGCRVDFTITTPR